MAVKKTVAKATPKKKAPAKPKATPKAEQAAPFDNMAVPADWIVDIGIDTHPVKMTARERKIANANHAPRPKPGK